MTSEWARPECDVRSRNALAAGTEQGSEQGIAFLTDTIISAANVSIPSTTPSPRRKRVPWWSLEVARAIAKRKRAFRSYLRLRDNHSLILRNKERAQCRKIIREAKRTAWRSFLSQLNYQTPLSKIWSLVRSLSGKRCVSSLPILRVNNTSITEPQDIVDTIAGTFARYSSSLNYRDGFIESSRRRWYLSADSFMSNNTEVYMIHFPYRSYVTPSFPRDTHLWGLTNYIMISSDTCQTAH